MSAEQVNSWPLISVWGAQGVGMTLSFLLVRASELLEPSEKLLRSPSGGIVVVFTFFFVFFSYHLHFLQAYRKHLCKNKQK